MIAPRQINKPCQLLVEGKDQFHFFEAMVGHLAIGDIQVQDFGGISQARPFLGQFVKAPSFGEVRRLGIVRDAETSASSAIQSLKDSLSSVGLPVPSDPGEFSDGSPSVGIMVLPDNRSPGMLETNLCETFEGTEIDMCITDFLGCAQRQEGVTIAKIYKARAHAWIATRPDPHLSVGYAAKRQYWDLAHESLRSIRDFVVLMSR